ncbi:MAG: carbohydrate kinase family protein [Pseudomonadota bacterium]
MTPDLVTVGGLTVDNVIAADGRVGLAQAGGNGAYSAVGALMWVERVGLVSTAVASYPRAALARLKEGGVDLEGVAWSEATIGACNWFLYNAAGAREEGLSSPPEALALAGFPTDRLSAGEVARWRKVLRTRDTAGELSYSDFRLRHPLTPEQVPEAWRAARGVLLAPSQPAVMRTMLDWFAGGGGLMVADPGWQLAEHRLDALQPLLERLDAFLPSEVELSAFVPGAAPGEALGVLARLCPGAVAVKLGAQGVLVWDRAASRPVEVPARPAMAVDPTGAGDSFCGGFLAGLVETGDPMRAAHFGAISAAEIVQHFGADGALPADLKARRAALDAEVVL